MSHEGGGVRGGLTFVTKGFEGFPLVTLVIIISGFSSFSFVGGREIVTSLPKSTKKYIKVPSDSPKYERMKGKLYKVVEEHEEYSNHENEDDFDVEKTVFDLKKKLLVPLNLKLLKKVKEKKWIFDKLFKVWLAVLEVKKKFLFQLWLKKQGKKKVDSFEEHYEYFIPYYTSTYKPHHYTKSYSRSHDAGYQSHDHDEDDPHSAHDEHKVYNKHEEDFKHESVDHQHTLENPYQATENLDADKDDVHIQEEDLSDGFTNNDDYDESLSVSVSRAIDEKSKIDVNVNSAETYITSPDIREEYESSASIKPTSSDSRGAWSLLRKMFE